MCFPAESNGFFLRRIRFFPLSLECAIPGSTKNTRETQGERNTMAQEFFRFLSLNY